MRPLLLVLLLAWYSPGLFAQALPSFPERIHDLRRGLTGRPVDVSLALAISIRDDARAASDELAVAEASRLIGGVYLQQDRFAEARQVLEEAIAIYARLGQRPQELECQVLFGRALAYSGEQARAQALVPAALRELLTLDVPRESLLSTFSHGLYALRFEGEDHRTLLETALALVPPDEHLRPACSLWQTHGDLLFNHADYVNAHAALTRALACYQATGQRSSAGRVLVSLGRVQRAHGQLHTALDYYGRAAAMQLAERDMPAWLQSLNAQAVTYDRLGQPEKAEALYRQAIAVAARDRLERISVFLQGNLAGSLLAAGRYAEALPVLEATAAAEQLEENRLIRLRQLAIAYQGLGRHEDALRQLEQARDSSGFDARTSWLNEHASVLAALGRLDEAQRDLDEARRLIEDARSRALSGDTTRTGFGELHQRTFATAIDIAMRRGDAATALHAAEQARARALLDLVQERGGAGTPAPPNVAEMQALARRLQTTLLVYWVAPTATIGWVVTPDTLRARRLDVTERRLRDLIRRAGGAGDVQGAVNAAIVGGADLAPWRALHRAVIAPLVADLPKTPAARLTIVPHGPLLHLPFAGLLDTSGRYLVERYTVHYAPSVAVLASAAARPAVTGTVRALVVGDPAPLPKLPGVELPPPLPRARAEARAVARRFAGGAVLSIGGAATERAVRVGLADYKWLHVATHARVAEEATAPSYLLLARGAGTADDDGLLTSDEVKSLPLEGATVVLSACRTALGRVTGEGTLGFTRSFLAAGARAIVATSWELPDEVGLRMMQAFYAARDRGIELSAALRAAQLAQLRDLRAGRVRMRAGAQPVTLPATPLLWAGYVAVGLP